MSDEKRPRRQSTKTAVREEQTNPKTARDEISRMYNREVREMPPPPSLVNKQRSRDLFDFDLPEQRQRQPLRPPVDVPLTNERTPRVSREPVAERIEFSRPAPVVEARAMLHHAETTFSSHWSSAPELPLYGEMRRRPWVMIVIAAVSIVIIGMFMMPQQRSFSNITHEPAAGELSGPVVASAPAPTGEHTIVRPPTLTGEQIDAVLRDYNSPAAGTGRDWVELGKKYNIDPAYALAFFVVESTAGTAQGWAGWKPDGSSTHNIGNIICAGYTTCYGRFRDYSSWQEGIEDWYKLIAVEYVQGRNLQTIEQIIPVYAPSFENDVPAYVNNVERMVSKWRAK